MKPDSIYFIDAIYDQFLAPFNEGQPPNTGVAADVVAFCSQKEHEKKSARQLALEKPSSEDKIFINTVKEFAGCILHLALFNLTHPTPNIRFRSFDLLARVGPISFGINYDSLDQVRVSLSVRELAVKKVLKTKLHMKH